MIMMIGWKDRISRALVVVLLLERPTHQGSGVS